MFYSQLLLSKKGALGIIWMAAHCHKRLKKDQVQQTNISSSVDKILDDEVPIVTHRILAFLLLGIVRIYSKKVEYLCDDCYEVLNRICSFFKTRKSARADVGVSRTQRHYDFITLPKRFELDTFDLGLDLDAMGGKVRAHDQVTLADGCRKDTSRSGSICKDTAPILEAHSTARTPPKDVFGAHRMDRDLLVRPSSNVNISLAGVEILRRTRRSLEDCVDLIQLDETERGQMHYKLSNKNWRTNCQGPTNDVGSHSDSDSDSAVHLSNSRNLSLPHLEMLRGIGFTLEDRLEPMVLDEAEQEQLYDRPSSKSTSSNVQGPIQDVELNSVTNQVHEGSNPVENMDILHESNFSLDNSPLNSAEKREGHDKPTNEDHGAEEKHMEHLNTQLSFQEGVDQVFTEAVDNTGPVGLEQEVIPPESVKCQKPENFRVSIDSILNPRSKLPDVGTVEVAAVQTPGRKERAKILKKRKSLVDVATVVPNKVLKSWIEEDPTDIKRGRKTIPHTLLQAWRAHKFCRAPHSFLEPSIPGVSVDLHYYGCRKSYASEIISAELSIGQDGLRTQEQIPDTIRSLITEKCPQQTPSLITEKCPQQIPVAEKLSGQIADATSLVLEKPTEQAPAVRSPVAEYSPEQIPIAPGTPVAYLNSLRSPHEAETVADSDILGPSPLLESMEKSTSSNQQLGLDALFQEETSSYEGDSLEKDAFSARTRATVNYLNGKFLHKKRRKEEQVLNLSHLLAGKTKKESTIMFYEILVLKTRDCIDVQQETAYRDILVRETPKLRQYFK